jgi:hypothetical protein
MSRLMIKRMIKRMLLLMPRLIQQNQWLPMRLNQLPQTNLNQQR